MSTASLNSAQRIDHLAAMTGPAGVDVLVIGGGVTGAGIALDAATRGLTTAIVEAQDWAAGTSSRSSRLVHGGLRYLYNLDFMLVAEALHERGLLLTRLAPHLVNDLQAAAVSLRPELEGVLEAGLEAGAMAGIVSGSGPTCAFLAANEAAAVDVSVRLSGMGVCRAVRRAVGPVPGARLLG